MFFVLNFHLIMLICKTIPIPTQQTTSHRRQRRLDQGYEIPESTGIGPLSAVLVGIAAVVIGCAAVLLVMDVHDRIHYEKLVESLRADNSAIHNNTGEGVSGNTSILPLTEPSEREEQAPMTKISTSTINKRKCQKGSVSASELHYDADVSTSSSDDTVYVEDSDPGAPNGTASFLRTQELSNEHLVLDFSDLSKLVHSSPMGTKKTDSLSSQSEDSSSTSKASSAITNSSLPGTAVEI